MVIFLPVSFSVIHRCGLSGRSRGPISRQFLVYRDCGQEPAGVRSASEAIWLIPDHGLASQPAGPSGPREERHRAPVRNRPARPPHTQSRAPQRPAPPAVWRGHPPVVNDAARSRIQELAERWLPTTRLSKCCGNWAPRRSGGSISPAWPRNAAWRRTPGSTLPTR